MRLYKTFLKISETVNRDRIFMYAAQASFFIIISAIPFLMLLLSMLRYILPVSETAAAEFVGDFFPHTTQSLISAVLHEIFHKDSLSVISFSAVSALWSASRGIAATERGIRSIYRTPERRFFVFNIAAGILYTIIFILIIALFLLIFVFGNFLFEHIFVYLSIPIRMFTLSPFLKALIAILVFTLFFAPVYAIFSGRKIKFSSQLPGALFTSAAWLAFSHLYSFYIDNFANHSYIYGSLTAIVFLMLWIYSCMLIFLSGAEINVFLLKYRRKKHR